MHGDTHHANEKQKQRTKHLYLEDSLALEIENEWVLHQVMVDSLEKASDY